MNSPVAYALLALATGIGIPVLAAINGALGQRLANPFAAGAVLIWVGLIVALTVTLVSTRGDVAPIAGRMPPLGWLYAGGLFMAFYILSITWLVPRFGVGNAVFFVLLGQIVMATVIDHFGLLGAPRLPIGPIRAAGVALMLVGVFLARRPTA